MSARDFLLGIATPANTASNLTMVLMATRTDVHAVPTSIFQDINALSTRYEGANPMNRPRALCELTIMAAQNGWIEVDDEVS